MKGFVKICGVTDVAAAEHAASVGADAIGLNLWTRSPRHVDLSRAAAIGGAVRGRVSIVAVLVDAREDEHAAVLAVLRPDLVQLHGDVDPAVLAAFPNAVEAVGLASEADVRRAIATPGPWVLVDAADPGQRGGTGKRVDPARAARVAAARRTVLAGGLNPDNVAEAIAAVRPWGVDVASGVESPAGGAGRKDPARVEAFVRAARTAFAAQSEA